ncbi:MAG TPA: stage III sporulation protein D [Clostridia bacterium]|nr:stage III sporulation protein D [Clostridia bacterium]
MDHDAIVQRVKEVAAYIIRNGATVREAAAEFRISKSTVHKDVTERLMKINKIEAEKVRKVLEKNKAERHIRGGEATRRKYQEVGKGAKKTKYDAVVGI